MRHRQSSSLVLERTWQIMECEISRRDPFSQSDMKLTLNFFGTASDSLQSDAGVASEDEIGL
jgi:hypothetical protein